MLFSRSTELKINPWVLMSAFALLVGPFALAFHMHYPDEIYYRDAAVKMMENGDYLTTYLGSGELRFKKPILTYWAVLAGFKLFGVSDWASRLFFLIAGAGTVGLTYLLGKTLFDSKKIAGLAGLIMAANPVLIFSATRSIPDVLLVLTMTGSAIGFAGLMRFGDQAPKRFTWILYLSLAQAFEVKGLPAAALGGLGIFYLLVNPWKRISWKTLMNIPALGISLVIALFWFVEMWRIHGPTYLSSFLEDQVGIRVASRALLILQNGLLALLLLVAMFIPWAFFGFSKSRQFLQKLWKENRVFFGFAILWALAILGMGAMTSKFYERYLLPVAPVLAVWLAWFLEKTELELSKKGLKIASVFFILLNLIILSFSLWLNFQQGAGFLVSTQLLLGVVILGYLVLLLWRQEKLPKVISYSVLLLFFLASTITERISFPHQGQQIRQHLESLQKEGIPGKFGFFGNLHAGSKIRLSVYPEVELVDIPNQDWKEKLQAYSNIILEDKFLDQIDLEDYRVEMHTVNWQSKAIPQLLLASGKPEFDSLLQANSKKYYWLVRKAQ
ncbi:glycosyltransferase family 39 protein [Algoriphagus sp. CAU 1675]|uniref:ArnT family glycosyltransferase n=1 Tax=Algoriphagus sp. CAU 1675 TaxID=3032597 RepID=UPI0023DCE9E2|nr:glycosyltransferase family 39 protein [Algoriphagus sp. CAU 1675]MDF2158778.1 glycosyltransferase family 39 protein [Algoriphagus sp. CAU 1675]